MIQRALQNTARGLIAYPILLMAIVCWMALLGWKTLHQGQPASIWFEVNSVYIPDIGAGQPVVLSVDRTIHRPFLGRWTVSLDTWNGAGFVEKCTGSGTSLYEPDDALPETVTLEWWIGHDRCTLPPGEHRVVTRWRIETAGDPRYVRAISNVFTVKGTPP